MRQTLVAGNWKLNGTKESITQLINELLGGIDEVQSAEVAVCPPYTYIPHVAELLAGSKIVWGGQNLCQYEAGAYTGEISAAMLLDYNCKYVIIGHSERRSIFGETNEQIAAKFVVAKKAGLIPIHCIGELLEERETGKTEQVLSKQIDAVIAAAGIAQFANTVIAYEPVWAIGTGKTATPDQAQDTHAFIRNRLADNDKNIAQNIQILYGGSVKPDNAKELFSMTDIDGGLIGGASLDAQSFLAICTSAN